MKKLIALIISIVLILAMGIPAFAESVNSPQNPVNYVVTCDGVKGAKDGSTSSIVKGSQITLVADKTKGTFDHWTINGDYTIVSGGLNSDTITIKPNSDVNVEAIFKPDPEVSYKVTCIGVSGFKNGGVINVNQGNHFTVTPDESLGTFSRWGVAGDYDIVSGSLSDKALTLTPKSDLVVTASVVNIKDDQKSPTDSNNNGSYDVQAGDGAVPVNGTSSSSGTWNGNDSVVGYNSTNNQLTVIQDPNKGTFNNWIVTQTITDENGKKDTIIAEPGVAYVPVVNPDEFGKTLPSSVTSSSDYQKVAQELKTITEKLEKEAQVSETIMVLGKTVGETLSVVEDSRKNFVSTVNGLVNLANNKKSSLGNLPSLVSAIEKLEEVKEEMTDGNYSQSNVIATVEALEKEAKASNGDAELIEAIGNALNSLKKSKQNSVSAINNLTKNAKDAKSSLGGLPELTKAIDEVEKAAEKMSNDEYAQADVIGAIEKLEDEVSKANDDLKESTAKTDYINAFDNYTNLVASKTNKTSKEVINDLLKSPVLTVIPLADIVINGSYSTTTGGQTTGGQTTGGKSTDGKPAEEQTTSPKNGDYSVYFALIALLSLAGAVVTSKKVFSK